MAKGKPGADAELDWLSINGIDALVEAEIMRDTKTEVRSIHLHACLTCMPIVDSIYIYINMLLYCYLKLFFRHSRLSVFQQHFNSRLPILPVLSSN